MYKNLIKKYQQVPRIVRASLWFVICSFMQKGISILTTPIFTRLMSTAEYGQYSVFNSWYSIVEVFVSLELSKGVYSQGIIKFSQDNRIFSSSFQGLNLVLFVFWSIIYFLFHNFFNQLLSLTTLQMLCMLAMIWATAAFELWSTEKRTNYSYQSLVVVTLFTSLLKPALSIVLILCNQDKVTARIVGLTLVQVITYSFVCILQLHRGKKFFSKKYWLYALGFNIPLIPHYLSQIVLASSDRIMINSMVSDAAAGIYSLAYSVSMIMRLLNTALNQTLSPWLYKHIKEKKIEEIEPVSLIALTIVAIGNLVLIAFAPEAISFFAPQPYHEAIWVVPPVAISVFFLYMYNYFACFEFYYEEKKYIGVASIVGAILNIILNFLCIPIWGYIAAAYTTLVCNILYTCAHYFFMTMVSKKYMSNFKVYNEVNLLKISILVLLLGFIFMSLYQFPILRYLTVILLVFTAIITKKKWINKVLMIIPILKRKN